MVRARRQYIEELVEAYGHLGVTFFGKSEDIF